MENLGNSWKIMENVWTIMENYGEIFKNLGKLWKIWIHSQAWFALMWIKLVEHDVIYLKHTNLEVCRLKLWSMDWLKRTHMKVTWGSPEGHDSWHLLIGSGWSHCGSHSCSEMGPQSTMFMRTWLCTNLRRELRPLITMRYLHLYPPSNALLEWLTIRSYHYIH